MTTTSSAETVGLVATLCRIRHLSHQGAAARRKPDSTLSEINRLAEVALGPYETPGHWLDEAFAAQRARPITPDELGLFHTYQQLWIDYKKLGERNAELEQANEHLKKQGGPDA